jgi:hypothetical protein
LSRRSSNDAFYGNDKTFTGEYLMNVGVRLRLYRPLSSAVLLITEEILEEEALDPKPVGE